MLIKRFPDFPLAALLCLYLIIPAGLSASDQTTPETVFVDLDGDGFNDLLVDSDANGIPDKIESEMYDDKNTMTGELGDVFNTSVLPGYKPGIVYSASFAYNRRECKAKNLTCHRGGFNSNDSFGPGTGIGQGALTSGCVGPGCPVP
jgi:hypothetical protein